MIFSLRNFRVQTLRISQSNVREYNEIIRKTYNLYCSIFEDIEFKTFERSIFLRGSVTYVAIYSDKQSRLLGFTAFSFQEFFISGKKHVAINGGNYFTLGSKMGPISLVYPLFAALRYKLFNPFSKLNYITTCCSAGAYHLLASMTHRTYPNPNYSTSDEIHTLLIEAMKSRNKKIVDEKRLLVFDKSRSSLRFKEKAKYAKSISSSPYKSYFQLQNPDLGNRYYMAVCVPLDFVSICMSLINTITYSKMKQRAKYSIAKDDRLGEI